MHIHRVLPRSISMIIKTMRIIESSSLLFLLLLIAATLFSLSLGANDTLTLSQPLSDADDRTLISAGSKFVLGFFTPAAGSAGNRYVGIWYNNISEHTPVWIANRDRPVTSRSGRLSLTTNGTLILTDDKSTVFWSSDSPAVPLANPVARLHDDGNFIVADDSGSVAWESFNFPTDTVLPDMKVRLNLTSGQIGNITSWTSDGNPTRGDYVTGFDLDGDPQIFTWKGKINFWRGGPWNGYIFTGIPEMRSEILHFEFIVEPQAVVFSYSVTDASVISKFTISYAGILQHLLWVEGLQAWKQFGFTPRD
ncbi:hypothetical protein Cni_G16779 [Canna indica]|uniref:Bulb-type lectin domain-containing protein n=1 Tax=Canna indica TaxID=4628 RepID=A0AAQ3KLF3_9LILI|nr:hypothetical protein Cni_G16779 [Canna indica]